MGRCHRAGARRRYPGCLPAYRGCLESRGRRAPLLDQRAQSIGVDAACGEARTIAHDDDVLTMEPGLQLLYTVDVHDRRPMNSNERIRIEPALHVLHALTQEV